MELQEFKQQFIREEIGITEDFGRIISFVDFANVNHWYEEDRQTDEHVALSKDEKIIVDVEKLHKFLKSFSLDSRLYYGKDPSNEKSLWFIQKIQSYFGKGRVFTKDIQNVRHHLVTEGEQVVNTRALHRDSDGAYVYLPKCNFDVEMSVDAVRVLDGYDTICLLSSDADFLYLLRFLKKKGKKGILVKGGHVVYQLKNVADVVINAQDIKKHIAVVKQKPGVEPGLADRNPESTGRTTTKDRTEMI